MRSFKWFYAAASIGLRPLIKLLDLLLFANGRNGSLTGTSYFGWVLFNIAILVILVVFASERAAIIGAGSLFVLHFVIIFSALLIIREETRVWDGLMEPNERLLPEVSCVRNVAVLVISSSALLFISACLLYQIDKFTSWHLLLRRPDISCGVLNCSYVSYLLVCIDQLPFFGSLSRRISEWFGYGYQVEFLRSAAPVRVLFLLATWTWILGVFRLVLQQSNDGKEFMQALIRVGEREEADKSKNGAADTIHYLQLRGSRAPGFMKPSMITAVISHPIELVRHLVVPILKHGRIFTFPQTFVFHLQQQNNRDGTPSRKMKLWGLYHSRDLVKRAGQAFLPEMRFSLFKNIAYQLRNCENDPPVIKSLLKLVNQIVEDSEGANRKELQNQLLTLCTSRLRADTSCAATQTMLIDFAKTRRLPKFCESFIAHFQEHDEEVQVHGLEAANELIASGEKVKPGKILPKIERPMERAEKARGGQYNPLLYSGLKTMWRLVSEQKAREAARTRRPAGIGTRQPV